MQIATLSRIEHQKMRGTVECHLNIAKALEIDLVDLYTGIEQEIEADLKPEKSATELFEYSDNSSYEILTAKLAQKKMLPTLLQIKPKGSTSKEQNKRGAEKFVYVLEGSVTVHINEKSYPLSPSNTLYFDASQKHWFENKGRRIAKAIVVGTPIEI